MMYKPVDGNLTLAALELKYTIEEVSVEFEWFQKIVNKRLPNEGWHGHRNMEMHFVQKGELFFSFEDGNKLTISEGEVILIPPKLQHKLSNPSGKKYIRFVWNVSISNEIENAQNRWIIRFAKLHAPLKLKCNDQVFSLLNECLEEAFEEKSGFTSIIKANSYKLLVLLSRELPQIAEEKPDSFLAKRSLYGIRVQKVIEFIEKSYDKKLTVKDIAEQIPICSKQLQRSVQAECHMTVNELYQKIKLQKAKELLKDSNLTFSQIAEQLGFESGQSFSRFFKRTEGQSPMLYRSAILPIDSRSMKTASEKGKSCGKCMK